MQHLRNQAKPEHGVLKRLYPNQNEKTFPPGIHIFIAEINTQSTFNNSSKIKTEFL